MNGKTEYPVWASHNVLDTLMLLNKEKVKEIYLDWKYGTDFDNLPLPVRSTFEYIFNNLNEGYLNAIIEVKK